jgi:curved DNA-binding protein CbpA
MISAKVLQAKAGDFFALLDLPLTATEKDIKEAYFRVARLVHPDSLQKQSLADRRVDAAYVFDKVTQAYQVLMDPKQREVCIKAKEAGAPAPLSKDDGKLQEEQAKIALHKGKMFLNRRSYLEAEKHLKLLTDLRPDDARGHLLLGWSIFQNQDRPKDSRLEEAKTAFARATKLEPDNPDGQYYMALYYKEKGDAENVRKHLKKAIQAKPDHVSAQRELRLLDMREQQKPEQQSIGDFLKGLFGKKKNGQ